MRTALLFLLMVINASAAKWWLKPAHQVRLHHLTEAQIVLLFSTLDSHFDPAQVGLAKNLRDRPKYTDRSNGEVRWDNWQYEKDKEAWTTHVKETLMNQARKIATSRWSLLPSGRLAAQTRRNLRKAALVIAIQSQQESRREGVPSREFEALERKIERHSKISRLANLEEVFAMAVTCEAAYQKVRVKFPFD